MQQILNAKKLNKYFTDPEEFHVIKDVSLAVNKGEFVTLTGKSGCGKSTLLYLLATLDTEYNGSIDINNTSVTGLSQNKLAQFRNEHIGFIFQYHFLLPEFTVLQNVMLPALRLGKHSAELIKENAMKKLHQLEMAEYAHKLSSKLSGGQQQRVAIARALINNPDIIMADEPTGNLDSVNTESVVHIFRELASEGNTLIVITHDEDIAKKSDRVLKIVDGNITDNIYN